MMFDQYGNYVVQRMLDIATQVRQGKRFGDPAWFDILANHITRNEHLLMKYSSGKNIIRMLLKAYKHVPPHFYSLSWS